MLVVKILSFFGFRDKVVMMSLRTLDVAVAVRHIMGTLGKVARKYER